MRSRLFAWQLGIITIKTAFQFVPIDNGDFKIIERYAVEGFCQSLNRFHCIDAPAFVVGLHPYKVAELLCLEGVRVGELATGI